MIRYFSTVIFVLTLCSLTNAQLSGPLSGVIEAGTYTIEGEISVEAGDSLVIEPGTEFNFQGHYKFIVNGWLFAEGTEADSITFTATDTSEGWDGIRYQNAPDGSRLRYCVLQHGHAIGIWPEYRGGAIICYNSNPVIENCTISDNTVEGYGGGIFCHYSSPTIANCAISDNTADYYGGGISCHYSSPTITNCTISGNIAAIYGGGIYCQYSSNPIITNCTISGNTADDGGGIYCVFSSNPSLINCTIRGNTANTNGGGIYCSYHSILQSNLAIINTIVEGNFGNYGVYWGDESTRSSVAFSDFYNNDGNFYQPPQGVGQIVMTNANGDPCDEFYNIFLNPLFYSTTGDSAFYLTVESPCIDAGNPDSHYNDPEDPANPGFALYPAMGTIMCDMGAYGGQGAIGWVGVADKPSAESHPETFTLFQNYPNPFNPSTTISFDLPKGGWVNLQIFDVTGRVVGVQNFEPLHAWMSTGSHQFIFNAEGLASGLYFAKLEAGGKQEVRKMMLVK